MFIHPPGLKFGGSTFSTLCVFCFCGVFKVYSELLILSDPGYEDVLNKDGCNWILKKFLILLLTWVSERLNPSAMRSWTFRGSLKGQTIEGRVFTRIISLPHVRNKIHVSRGVLFPKVDLDLTIRLPWTSLHNRFLQITWPCHMPSWLQPNGLGSLLIRIPHQVPR